ncbi:MAG TPA: putative toxin-antitoxin system toxin component, PIN family [Anaerolineales bacterium]|nr:putative toxin-antitoxin system toxin component, PIN family [Anaerolineales bacterium]
MRAVLDTNILIRALIRPQGRVGPIIPRLAKGDYALVYSAPIRNELIAKLPLPRIRNKYNLTDTQIEALLDLIALRGQLVAPERRVKICRDPHDDMFIEAALAGSAEYVVTGDDDLLSLEKFETVQFIIPRQFLATLDNQRAEE